MNIFKKKAAIVLIVTFYFIGFFAADAQTNYYRIRMNLLTLPAEWNWRDSLFVVKISDPAVQAKFAQELALPWPERTKIINGTVVEGDGGFNRNGTHCFNWHYIDDASIDLVDFSAEVCDGLPYTDCELSNFPASPGYFCPWSWKVLDEIDNPESCSLGIEKPREVNLVMVFPNPAKDKLKIIIDNSPFKTMYVAIYDLAGQLVYFQSESFPISEVSLSGLSRGIYNVIVNIDENVTYQKIIVE